MESISRAALDGAAGNKPELSPNSPHQRDLPDQRVLPLGQDGPEVEGVNQHPLELNLGYLSSNLHSSYQGVCDVLGRGPLRSLK